MLTRARAARLLIVSLVAVSATACNWTQIAFDGANTRNNSFEQLLPNAVSVDTVHGLGEAWTTANPRAATEDFGSPPIIGNGRVFMMSLGRPGHLYAFDSADGEFLWSADIGNFEVGPWGPALAGDKVIIGRDGGVVAFDAAGLVNCAGSQPNRVCNPVWQTSSTDLGATTEPIQAASTPIVSDDIVYVATNGRLLALQTSDGSQVWVSAPGSFSRVSYPTVGAGRVFAPAGQQIVGFDRAGIAGCQANGGATICSPTWIGSIATFAFAPPAYANGKLYSPGGDVFDVVGRENCTGTTPIQCTPVWKAAFDPQPGLFSHLGVAATTLYVTRSSTTKHLFGVDARGVDRCAGTPKLCGPIREYALHTGTAQFDLPPAIANGVVYVGTPTGMRAFDATGHVGCSADPMPVCEPLWSTSTAAGIPSIADGTVYSATGDALTAYRLNG